METPKITKQEMLEAISEGVSNQFWTVMPEAGQILESIRKGVEDAMWRMITNATNCPCGDFFHFVQQGVSEGIIKSLNIHDMVEKNLKNEVAQTKLKTVEDSI